MAHKTRAPNHGEADRPIAGSTPEFSKLVVTEEYKVGPGRPPKQFQFKPGQSGNPKGAKRRKPSLIPDVRLLFDRAFGQEVSVTQGERKRDMTMFGAGMQQLAVQFAKGDRHARRDAFWIAERLGSALLTPQNAFSEIAPEHRKAILDLYVARQIQSKQSSAPSFVPAPPELLDDDPSDKIDNN
jgi:Family of unknown function (DUF5681)